MQFGIFDQNDRSGLPLARQYEQRLQLAELYDRCGFARYHTSEHHGTPLSTAPSPSVLMAALSQRTRRLRLCPLVYILPLHHPARLAEEICMLDHLSNGRIEFGVGRGASPHELEALGVDPAQAKRMYAESLEILDLAFTSDTLTYEGEFWTLDGLAIEMRPLQQPHPPMWCAVASPDSAASPARRGTNVVCGGPVAGIRAITDRYRAERTSGGEHPLIGVNRYIIVAEDDETARDIGRKAWPAFYDNFFKLWRRHGTEPVNAKLPPQFDQLLATGHAVAGSVGRVTDQLAGQIEGGALNYLIGSFTFGTMPHRDAVASVTTFADRVMPVLAALDRVAA